MFLKIAVKEEVHTAALEKLKRQDAKYQDVEHLHVTVLWLGFASISRSIRVAGTHLLCTIFKWTIMSLLTLSAGGIAPPYCICQF